MLSLCVCVCVCVCLYLRQCSQAENLELSEQLAAVLQLLQRRPAAPTNSTTACLPAYLPTYLPTYLPRYNTYHHHHRHHHLMHTKTILKYFDPPSLLRSGT